MRTITTRDCLGLVTVDIDGASYVVTDIAMRMLQPRELYRAQGFPDSYVIDRGPGGRRLTKTEQVRMVGNSVAPPIAAALVRANVPELIARDEAARWAPGSRRFAGAA
ncbi:MAG TPA: DNA cytosine methyltransferase [Longimicrobiales bacterium]